MSEEKVVFDPKAFAKRMYRREVFLSDMLHSNDASLLCSVFMPLPFLNEEGRHDLRDRDVTCLYGEMKDAAPIGINGYPMFYAYGTLTREEHRAVIAEYNALLELLEETEG